MSIFYKSLRVGKGGKTFWLYKFRTMIEDAERMGPASTAGDDPRITKIGQFLRKYKLDELPQIWNIVKGDMVLVGPRPTVQQVIDTLPEFKKNVITSVKPGLTCLDSLWNCNEEERLAGALDPHQKFMDEIYPELVKLQIKYVYTRSLSLDIQIIIKTLWKILMKI